MTGMQNDSRTFLGRDVYQEHLDSRVPEGLAESRATDQGALYLNFAGSHEH